tara:strand:+ start:13904 stop:14491 length:588 start_codon:yes stop_codon:yes gene_type:complete
MFKRFFLKSSLLLLRKVFEFLSDKKHKKNNISKNINSPTLFLGQGDISISKEARLGVLNAPNYYFSYIHIEARNKNSKVVIKKGVYLSNSITIISENSGIYISENVLIGHNVQIYDSDFHSIYKEERINNIMNYNFDCSVFIGKNSWVGANTLILKGVKIGQNSVIAANSTVTKNIPDNSLFGGSPAKLIKKINN